MIPKTKKLFISYRSSDAAKVDKIARDLTLLKYDDGTPRYTTWQDKHNLPPASPNWWDAILDAIEQCDMFVFHLSRASLESVVCRAELEYAHKRFRPIIPLVLDGEFFLNADSGKYDLPKETWALVPEWLGQAQFLFYVETQFYSRFQESVAVFERNWPRDIPAPRPLNPDKTSGHGSNHALYDAACDYAERLAFADAEKHFEALVSRNDRDYADFAAQWIEIIRKYAELIEIASRRSARVIFNRKVTEYHALFPRDFLDDGIFDPKGFLEHALPLGDKATEVPKPQPKPAPSTSIALMPAPFDWIAIPGGSGTMKSHSGSKYAGRAFTVLTIPTERYAIGKYPVTNAQYAKFIEAGGYAEKRWWTEAGWSARRKRGTRPLYWTNKDFNGAEHPVVGVSWYEAVAFCLWLSDVTGENIMLPTEDQWQYAAQSDDGRVYPWGNEFDEARCNAAVSGRGKTTPVRQYEGKGDSPFGVVDMAGNVWEWCLTEAYQYNNNINGSGRRVQRGGSWNQFPPDADTMYRVNYKPDDSSSYVGFRVVRVPSL